MDYIPIIKDSILTAVSMKFFKSIPEATNAHINKATFIKAFPLSKFKNVINFNPERLQPTAIGAYPLHDRPRGKNDILSVKFHQKCLQQHKDIQPVWLLSTKNQYVLLDGAHRIVAAYIEKKCSISAYVIQG
jgi:hypothetical protein